MILSTIERKVHIPGENFWVQVVHHNDRTGIDDVVIDNEIDAEYMTRTYGDRAKAVIDPDEGYILLLTDGEIERGRRVIEPSRRETYRESNYVT